jgi:hypothetical protein
VLVQRDSVSLHIGKDRVAVWTYSGELTPEIVEQLRTVPLAPEPGSPNAA